ncbi:MAG: hypothetical protein HN802_06010 [Candidatus Jacksonbacteria bacterium]|jgi:hypothetical protein|nr:hypothetical protein [Candidatus Jacksonbacteria bacterium]MBT6955536.1 hypothetical protein [Candidatus Jacksonbacteria bacterium]MBT7339221.1 hypothetical protein [Candidatus Jacksonbacteria bacterium]
MDLLKTYFSTPTTLLINQKRKQNDQLSTPGHITKFFVLDDKKNPIGFIAELSGGFIKEFKQTLGGRSRAFDMILFNEKKEKILRIHREYTWRLSHLSIFSSDDQLIGSVTARQKFFKKHAELKDQNDSIFAITSSKNLTSRLPAKFSLQLPHSENPTGLIERKWSSRNDFEITFGNHPWDTKQKAIIFSSVIGIYFDHYQRDLFTKWN